MTYNIKDAVDRIDIYSQRNLKAKPMSQHDKQMISGHILPLIIEKGVSRTEKVDQQTGHSAIVPESSD